jgi:hypothetical protein
MKNLRILPFILISMTFFPFAVNAQVYWQASGNNIYNTNIGNVGINTSSPFSILTVSATSSLSNIPILKVIAEPTAGATTTALYVGSNGKVGIGTPTPFSLLHSSLDGGSITSGLSPGTEALILSSNIGTALRIVGASDTFNTAPNLVFMRARNSVASPNIVQSGDRIMTILGQGYDGSTRVSAGAIIIDVDGTPGSSDMPGRIIFSTTPDGSNAPLERVRIDSVGNVGIGTTTPSEKLTVSGNIKLSGNLTSDGDICIGMCN